MKYIRLRTEVKKENERFLNSSIKAINENDYTLKHEATTTRYNQYLSGKITKEELISFTTARIEKKFAKRLEEKLSYLDSLEQESEVESIDIFVNWKKSYVWGYNPTAQVTIWNSERFDATGTASGCGYDKRSTSVASALNQIKPIVKMLCDCKERALRKGIKSECGNSPFIAYGAGYGAIPQFEGGVGFSCFDKIFVEKLGFRRITEKSTDTTDFYYYERKRK